MSDPSATTLVVWGDVDDVGADPPDTFDDESFEAAVAEMPGVDESDLVGMLRSIERGFGHSMFLDRAAPLRSVRSSPSPRPPATPT